MYFFFGASQQIKLFFLIFFLLLCGSVVSIYFYTKSSQHVRVVSFATSTPSSAKIVDVSFDVFKQDGEYAFETEEKEGSVSIGASTIFIASSTKEYIHYEIQIVNHLHTGVLEGDAYRDNSTSSLSYYSSSTEECPVMITFLRRDSVVYTTEYSNHKGADQSDGCTDYHGERGRFFNGSIHSRIKKDTI